MPWLEPDIGDVIRGFDTDAASASQVTDVVVVPIGFVSDHMEVIQDLDTDAAAAAAEVGLGFTRVATSSTDVRFIEMIVDLGCRARRRGHAGGSGRAWSRANPVQRNLLSGASAPC